ncbi:hypothetical protein D3C71_354220 [compost metagenome]
MNRGHEENPKADLVEIKKGNANERFRKNAAVLRGHDRCTASLMLPAISHAADDVRIGLVTPMAGANARFGGFALRGARLAIKEINEAAGVNCSAFRSKACLRRVS